METTQPAPLILLPGLAADEQIFAPQKLAIPRLIVPPWPDPQSHESLEAYAVRMADQLREYGPCWIGGASFGGIVALHIAQSLKPQGVILIGSIRGPDEFPHYLRFARHFRPFVRYVPVRVMQLLCFPLASTFVRRFAPYLRAVAWQFCHADPRLIKWSVSELLAWHTTPEVPCPIYQIHGERDYVLPGGNTNPDQVIARGRHLISLTHPQEVNQFIQSVLNSHPTVH